MTNQNKFQQRIIEKGRMNRARLILPEEHDPRVIEAKSLLRGIGYEVLDLDEFHSKRDFYFNSLNELQFFQKMPTAERQQYLDHPLHLGMSMVRNGDADGLVAGAATPTSEVLRAAIWTLGIKAQARWVSSIFFMTSPDGEKAYTYADCGVIPEPSSDQLASIAGSSAEFHRLLTGDIPKVAFLSFSTKGSASHHRVNHVRKAVTAFSQQYPHIVHDGELQFDTATVPEVARKKAPNSPLQGEANVLIFPNLDAGNIAYKITERIAGFTAWGPLLQGLNKPVHDLSRGCSVDDIVNVAAITAMQKNL